MNYGLEGIITLITRDENMVEIDRQVIHNEILDSGLDHLASGNTGLLAVCKIGTGTGAVDVAQTALGAQAATTTTAGSAGDNFYPMTASSPRYNRYVVSRRFAAGTLNGTYTEIGFGPASGSLFNRALISPTKTVLSTETLDVEYELRTYIPSADATGTVTIGGTSRNFTLRPLDINRASATTGNVTWGVTGISSAVGVNAYAAAYTGGALAAQTAGEPTYTAMSTSGSTSGSTPDAYVAGTGYRKVRFSWGLSELNVAGGSFKHLVCAINCAKYQIEFDPPITKDATKTMSIDIGVTFSRYVP